MPNYKLNSIVRGNIIDQAAKLIERRTEYSHAAFPLTAAGMQTAVISPTQFSLVSQLANTGYKGTSKMNHLNCLMDKEHFPGLERSVILLVQVPESIHVAQLNYFSMSTKSYADAQRSDLYILNPPDQDDRDALVAWANDGVKAHRMGQLAMHTVIDVLGKFACTGNILAEWPMLATLVSRSDWRNRFRMSPVSLKRYRMIDEARAHLDKQAKFMAATDMVLTGAQLLEPYVVDRRMTNAQILFWEPKPTDRVFE